MEKLSIFNAGTKLRAPFFGVMSKSITSFCIATLTILTLSKITLKALIVRILNVLTVNILTHSRKTFIIQIRRLMTLSIMPFKNNDSYHNDTEQINIQQNGIPGVITALLSVTIQPKIPNVVHAECYR